LIVRSADIDGPCEARPYPEYRLLPTEAFHAQPDESLTAGQVDRRLQEECVDQFEPSLLNALPDSGTRSGRKFMMAIRLLTSDRTKA